MTEIINPDDDVWFDDDDVNIEMLMDVFNTTTFSAQPIANGVFVKTGFKYPISIIIDDYCGVLKFRAQFHLKDDFDEIEIFNFIDHLNESFSCCSFYLHTNDENQKIIVGSAFVTHHIGLTLRHLYVSAIAFASSFINGCMVDEDGDFFDFSNLKSNERKLM